MRFLWLTLTILSPIVTSHVFVSQHNTLIQDTYLFVGVAFVIVALGITIAEFVKHRNKERHEENRRLQQERDEDIAKWRKAFFAETSDLYDAQKVMLTKAQELGEHHASYWKKAPSTGQ